jgi:hypothetical protein
VDEVDEIERRAPNTRFFSSESVAARERRLFRHLQQFPGVDRNGMPE